MILKYFHCSQCSLASAQNIYRYIIKNSPNRQILTKVASILHIGIFS